MLIVAWLSLCLSFVPLVRNADPPHTLVRVAGEEKVELGRLPVGGSAVHRREVENVSSHLIELRVVNSSCPCVEVKILPDNRIEPNRKAMISMAAPVPGAAGIQNHWAIIEATSLDTDGSRLQTERFGLAVEYEADLAFVVQPAKLWITAIEGEPIFRTIYIRSTALDALNVRNIHAAGEGLHVKKVRRFRVPAESRPGEEALAITLEGRFSGEGLRHAELRFQTDDPAYKEAWLPIDIRILDRWIADPAGFAVLFPPDGGRVAAQSVEIRSRTGEELPELRFSVTPDPACRLAAEGLAFKLDSEDGRKSVRLSLVADANRIEGNEGIGEVTITDTSGKVVCRVPFAWIRLLRSKEHVPNPSASP